MKLQHHRVSPFLFLLLANILLLMGHESVDAFIITPNSTPWARSASGRRFSNGEVATLTWSIVPDGTQVTDGLSDLGGSDLLEFLNEQFDGDPNESDHTQQPWFPIIESSLERWSEVSGLTFVYEPNDDGGNHSNLRGILGQRGDIRIAGTSIDGRSGTLAFNFLPESGGDMAIDTDEISFSNPRNNYRLFRSTIMHEIGHAFGLSHVSSDTDDLLMDAFANTSVDGPQLDEVRGIQFYFGDALEKTNDGLGNGSLPLATDLGLLPIDGSLAVGADANVPTQAIAADTTDFVSISHIEDIDYYSFSVTGHSILTAALTPRGGTFTQAGEIGIPTFFDANARIDLSLSLFDSDGSILASVDDGFAGDMETLEDIELTPGTYFARIEGDTDNSVQLYELGLSLVAQDILGDCNGDGVIDAADIDCACSGGLAEVLTQLDAESGDLDLNGQVDFADFLILSSNFGQQGSYQHGDLDCDGDVAFSDFLDFGIAFRASADARIAGGSAASVPEPSGFHLLAVFAVVFPFARRR